MSAIPGQRRRTREEYERLAEAFRRARPRELDMEATRQSIQREIVHTGLAILKLRKRIVNYFGELLVQQQVGGDLVQVVPDTMVILGELEERDRSSYEPQEEEPVFLVVEYVSPSDPYKEYTTKRRDYEKMQVPYYLVCDPEAAPLVLCLYRHTGEEYALVPANAEGRFAIPELGLEFGLIDGWARLWLDGQLLPLTAELQAQADELQRQLQDSRKANEKLGQKATELEQKTTELEQKTTELEQKTTELEQANTELQQTTTELQQANTELEQKTTELQQANTGLQQANTELEQKTTELQQKTTELEEELRQRDERIDALAAALRPLVEARARQAGRQDVLDALPGADAATLTRWLAELG
jgi:Uma2 family endonuclease